MYRAQWAAYIRWRVGAWVLASAMTALAVIVELKAGALPSGWLVFAVPALYAIYRAATWPCPRCGEMYFPQAEAHVFVKYCRSCELPKSRRLWRLLWSRSAPKSALKNA